MTNSRIVFWGLWATVGIVLLVFLWLYFTGPTTFPPSDDPIYTPDSTSTSVDIPIDTNDLPQGGKG